MAGRLGVSERHLERVFKIEIGATPGVIARSRRARLARQLLTETSIPITTVAFSAGFKSVRAFNDAIRQIYHVTPTDIRRGTTPTSGSLQLQLPDRPPLAIKELLGFLRRRAIPGVEEVSATSYRRSIRFGSRGAVVALRPAEDAVTLTVETDEVAPFAPVVQRARQLFDLDADPNAIDGWLERSRLLGPLLGAAPGLRLVGTFDGFETGVHAILQQGASVAAATSAAGRIAARLGTPLVRSSGGITHLFPKPSQLGAANLGDIRLAPRPRAAIARFAEALARGQVVLDGSADLETTRRQLVAIPGIGPRTASILAMRALRDPDAFPARDAALRRSFSSLSGESHTTLEGPSHEWRPWRGYAAMHLWAHMEAIGPGGRF